MNFKLFTFLLVTFSASLHAGIIDSLRNRMISIRAAFTSISPEQAKKISMFKPFLNHNGEFKVPGYLLIPALKNLNQNELAPDWRIMATHPSNLVQKNLFTRKLYATEPGTFAEMWILATQKLDKTYTNILQEKKLIKKEPVSEKTIQGIVGLKEQQLEAAHEAKNLLAAGEWIKNECAQAHAGKRGEFTDAQQEQCLQFNQDFKQFFRFNQLFKQFKK